MALENTIHEALERDSAANSRGIEEARKKAISTYLEDAKKYSIGRTIVYAIGGTILGGIFSFLVYPVAPLLALFGYLGTAAGVYVGHTGQFESTREVTSDLEKSVHDAETGMHQRLIPQPA